ncbi:MAG: glycosyltransferase family 39 protein [Elusimicrobia bacterium]|nr:glycosyltransferase family 39 protein [Elusimicrobiota bacterium]
MNASATRRTLGYGALLAFAFAYTYALGFHTFDGQDSIVYDGGWRAFNGQVPFRDFIAAVGPFQFWLCGLFFKVFGPVYSSYALMGGLMNAAGTALVLRAAWRVSRDHRLAAACGLVTALWFMPIEASRPTFNNFAYLFVMAALALLLESGTDRPSPRDLAAGLCVAVAFYSKQTIGGLGGAFLGLFLLQAGLWRRALAFAAACAAFTLAATGAWLALDAGRAWRHLFVLPLTHRLGWTGAATAPWWAPDGLALALVALGVRFLPRWEWPAWALASYFLAKSPFDPRFPLMSAFFFLPLVTLAFQRDRLERALTLTLVLVEYLPHKYSVAETYQFLPFMGLQMLLFWKAYIDWSARPENKARLSVLPGPLAGGAVPVIAATFALLMFNGLRVSLKALTDSVLMFSVIGPAVALTGAFLAATFFAAARKERRMAWAGAASLLLVLVGTAQAVRTWRLKHAQVPVFDPLRLKDHRIAAGGLEGLTITREEGEPLEATIAYLRALPPERRPFFVFPDYSSLYFATGQVPPQPFLWFFRDLSYEAGPPDDAAVCGALRVNAVKTIVLTDRGPEAVDLPCLKALLSDWAEDRRFERGGHSFRVLAPKTGMIQSPK